MVNECKKFEIGVDVNITLPLDSMHFIKYQRFGTRQYKYFGYKHPLFNRNDLVRINSETLELKWAISEPKIASDLRKIVNVYKNEIKEFFIKYEL